MQLVSFRGLVQFIVAVIEFEVLLQISKKYCNVVHFIAAVIGFCRSGHTKMSSWVDTRNSRGFTLVYEDLNYFLHIFLKK